MISEEAPSKAGGGLANDVGFVLVGSATSVLDRGGLVNTLETIPVMLQMWAHTHKQRYSHRAADRHRRRD